MFGVILWNDHTKNRAVIWCEDHGDLAFYQGGETREFGDATTGPGDLIEFDLKDDGKMRLASNPRVVTPEKYPTLMLDLQSAMQESGAAPQARQDRAPVRISPKTIVFGTGPGAPDLPDGPSLKAV